MRQISRLFKPFTLLLLLLMTGATGAVAQSSVRHGIQKSLMGIEVHFRFDKHQLDLDYMGNDVALDRFARVIDSIGLHHIDSVVIVSQSSPEGSYHHNIKLSQRRAATMRRVLEERHPELGERLHIHPDGESWERLRQYVADDRRMKKSTIQQVLSVIDSDVNIYTKKWRMEQLPVYRYLRQTYYPQIRNSVFCIIYFDLPLPIAGIDIPPVETQQFPKPPRLPITVLPPLEDTPLLIKTNLPYDAVLFPSIEIEYRVAPHWSVLADYSVA